MMGRDSPCRRPWPSMPGKHRTDATASILRTERLRTATRRSGTNGSKAGRSAAICRYFPPAIHGKMNGHFLMAHIAYLWCLAP